MSMSGGVNDLGLFAPKRNEVLTTPGGVLTPRAAAFFENITQATNIVIDVIDVTDVVIDSANTSRTYALIATLQNQMGFSESAQLSKILSRISALENSQILYPAATFSDIFKRIESLEAQLNINNSGALSALNDRVTSLEAQQ